jgi:uroporphyrinogen-III synthase
VASGERNEILVTRPEPGASETATRIAELGFKPVLAPLLVVQPTTMRLPTPGRLQAVIVTSRNGVTALPAAYRPLPLFAVGDATAVAASELGFASVTSASGDATDLAALIARLCRPDGGPLLFATGTGQGGTLAAALRAAGFGVLRRVVYAARPVPAAPQAMIEALARGSLRSAVFFSTATALHFNALLADLGRVADIGAIEAIAISRGCSTVLSRLPWRDVLVAQRPTQDGILALLR